MSADGPTLEGPAFVLGNGPDLPLASLRLLSNQFTIGVNPWHGQETPARMSRELQRLLADCSGQVCFIHGARGLAETVARLPHTDSGKLKQRLRRHLAPHTRG